MPNRASRPGAADSSRTTGGTARQKVSIFVGRSRARVSASTGASVRPPPSHLSSMPKPPPRLSSGSGALAFLAAGSGITPMLSIASSVLSNPNARVTLLYGNRTYDDVIFRRQLDEMMDRWPGKLRAWARGLGVAAAKQ